MQASVLTAPNRQRIFAFGSAIVAAAAAISVGMGNAQAKPLTSSQQLRSAIENSTVKVPSQAEGLGAKNVRVYPLPPGFPGARYYRNETKDGQVCQTPVRGMYDNTPIGSTVCRPISR